MFNTVFSRFYFLILLFFSFSISLNAQNWLTGNGGATNDEALDVISDANGNCYVTGYYTSNATFGSTTLNSNGSSDVFVAKYDANGVIQWAISAGGKLPDKGNSITADKIGNIYITGTYYETASFGNVTINSASKSQDIFIAKYDINGILSWVKSLGGADSEVSYGIATDSDENVIITGQFRGTFSIGATTLNSTLNNGGTPSFDVYTLKVDKNANFLWAKQGKARYDDRGLDIAVDAMDNILVVGQFSDTIQFDVVHNNTAINAGYLMQYDKNGNESWFIRLNSQQTLINGVAVDKNNDVFITGDFQGTLRIYTTPISTNTSNFLYKIFVAKFSNSGNFIWVENDGSDSEVTSKSVAVDNNKNAYITGLFKCRFDEYSQQYKDGNGIFYSIGYRDVFITKYSAIGERVWFKQFGGSKDDFCSGITVKNPDKPIIAGSFEHYFHVPYSPAFIVSSANEVYGDSSFTYCTLPNYNAIISQYTQGQKDIFITSPVDISQAPLDLFQRVGMTCNQNFTTPCIMDCKDTLISCGATNYLKVNSFEQFQQNTHFESQYNYTWNTGSNSDIAYPNSTGDYWVKLNRKDGCFQSVDSIYVVINKLPEPWITDSKNVNSYTSLALPIGININDTVTLWGTNESVGDKVFWTGPNHIKINDNTIRVTKVGEYVFHIVTAAGCSSKISIEVGLDTLGAGSGGGALKPGIVFNTIVKDTVIICEGDGFNVKLIDSSSVATNGDLIPYKTVYWALERLIREELGKTYTYHSKTIYPDSTGWYTLYATLYNPIGSPSIYPVSRKFYAIVKPKPIITINIDCLTDVCPNDTVTLKVHSSVDNFSWYGNNIINDLHDSIIVVAPKSGTYEFYQIYGYYVDTVTGCGDYYFAHCLLNARNYPHVTVLPIDAIICPNDSALLTCEPGASYRWFSSGGNIKDTVSNIYAHVPGNYFCIQTSADGCTQTSNFVEVKEYNTPNLEVTSYTICLNGSTDIYVIAGDLAVVEWQPPLSGNSLTQTITAPGKYTCNITQCGILTTASVIIYQKNVPSIITALDSLLCPGDTLMLLGNVGAATYNWIGKNNNSPYLSVSQPGTYTLETTDMDGCAGISTPFIITASSPPSAPTVNDTIICYGQKVALHANSLMSIHWFDNPTGVNTVFTGPTFITDKLNQNTTYYVQADDSHCKSDIKPVQVALYPENTGNPNLQLSASADNSTILVGKTTILHAITSSNDTVRWFPANDFNDIYLRNQTVSPDVSSTYTVIITDAQGCFQTSTVSIVVIPNPCEVSNIYVPNTFTPNNDNANDVLYVRGNNIPELYFAVYNRWGEMVFETSDQSKGWDGNYKGLPADPVVFHWYIRAKCENGTPLQKKGNVTLVR